jgi:hypothetical protein
MLGGEKRAYICDRENENFSKEGFVVIPDAYFGTFNL